MECYKTKFPQFVDCLVYDSIHFSGKKCLTHLKSHAEICVYKVCCVALSLKVIGQPGLGSPVRFQSRSKSRR